MSVVSVRVHEIILKRGNRARFATALRRNIRRACVGLPIGEVRDDRGRVLVEMASDTAWPAVRERLRRVFGIANFSHARSLPMSDVLSNGTVDLGRLGDSVVEAVRGRSFGSFRIDTRRAEKSFPLDSPAINRWLGARVKEATGARVDLDAADLTVTVEVLADRVLWSVEKVPGPGGLPVGTSGHVVALLSGGIDSPVAAVRLMRRGCRVTFVHFHSAPFLDRSSQDKTRELVRLLAAWQPDVHLVVVPFGELQREIVTRVEPAPRVVLYRRMMLRIACEIADAVKAEAVVTGDSLAQVASQTLRNLVVIGEASRLPVLRPLVGMDKDEVIAEARRLGTFEISIEPDQDCCSLFVPRHPVTRARFDRIEECEARLDVPALVAGALGGATLERYRFPFEAPEPTATRPFLREEASA